MLREPGAGYALATDGELIASRLPLARLADALITQLLHQAALPGSPVVDAILLSGADGTGVLCLLPDGSEKEALVERLRRLVSERAPDARLGRGVRLSLEAQEVVEALGLPLVDGSSDPVPGDLILPSTCGHRSKRSFGPRRPLG